jgi:predicted site-specific integrase-resolvase
MRPKQFARLVGLSPGTVYQYAREGRIPAIQPSPGVMLIPVRRALAALGIDPADVGISECSDFSQREATPHAR